MNKRWITLILVSLAIVIPITMAMAQGPGQCDGQRRGMGRPVYGVITDIDAGQIVIEPQIPPEMAARMAEAGREPPELPVEVVLLLDENSEFYLNSAAASAEAFSIGDTVVIVTDQGEGGVRVANKIADPETAREYLRQRMGECGPGMCGNDGQGWRSGGGPGGPPGERRGRPAFGEVISITDSEVTIRPEIPDFVLERMAERGKEPPADLPDEITISLNDRTRCIQNSEIVEGNPFGVGDLVVIMAGRGEGDSPVAMMMSDWASAEARLADMGDRGERRGDWKPGNPRPKDGQGTGKPRGQGKYRNR